MSRPTWYADLDRMAEDDAYLQRVYTALRADLTADARRRTRMVHAYPSCRCTYTLDKERIFVKVRDDASGELLPECLVRHVLLHELAHTINDTHGHGTGFQRWLRWLGRGGGVVSCGERVPPGYNPCV